MSAVETAKQIDGVCVDGHSGATPPFRQRTLTVPPVKPYFLNFLHLREAAFVEKEEFSNRGCFKIGNCILLRNEKWVSQRGQWVTFFWEKNQIFFSPKFVKLFLLSTSLRETLNLKNIAMKPNKIRSPQNEVQLRLKTFKYAFIHTAKRLGCSS